MYRPITIQQCKVWFFIILKAFHRPKFVYVYKYLQIPSQFHTIYISYLTGMYYFSYPVLHPTWSQFRFSNVDSWHLTENKGVIIFLINYQGWYSDFKSINVWPFVLKALKNIENHNLYSLILKGIAFSVGKSVTNMEVIVKLVAFTQSAHNIFPLRFCICSVLVHVAELLTALQCMSAQCITDPRWSV